MRTAIAILAGLVLAGCATTRSDLPYRVMAGVTAPVIPPLGLIYTNLHAPLSLGPTSFGAKRGTAVSYEIGMPPLPYPGLVSGPDLFAWGDASEKTAAANAGITKIQHADYSLLVVLWLYRRFTIEVYGD